MPLLIAHRPLLVDNPQGVAIKVVPGGQFEVTEEVALDLESRGLARREAKSLHSSPENKMLAVPEDKSDVGRRRRTTR